MTLVDPNAPPVTVGGAPQNGFEVNRIIGACLHNYIEAAAAIAQNQNWLAGADLKVPPYNFSATQETDIKTGISTLDTALRAIDMTFVNRLIGLVS